MAGYEKKTASRQIGVGALKPMKVKKRNTGEAAKKNPVSSKI